MDMKQTFARPLKEFTSTLVNQSRLLPSFFVCIIKTTDQVTMKRGCLGLLFLAAVPLQLRPHCCVIISIGFN